MSVPHDASWTLRKIFQLRPLVQPLVQYIIGNEHNTILWLDHWHAIGPSFQQFGQRVFLVIIWEDLLMLKCLPSLQVEVGFRLDSGILLSKRFETQPLQTLVPHETEEDKVSGSLPPLMEILLRLLAKLLEILGMLSHGLMLFGFRATFPSGLLSCGWFVTVGYLTKDRLASWG